MLIYFLLLTNTGGIVEPDYFRKFTVVDDYLLSMDTQPRRMFVKENSPLPKDLSSQVSSKTARVYFPETWMWQLFNLEFVFFKFHK